MKRLREEQQEARRSNNYRLPLSKASNSFEGHSRKSSMSSKDSQQVLFYRLPLLNRIYMKVILENYPVSKDNVFTQYHYQKLGIHLKVNLGNPPCSVRTVNRYYLQMTIIKSNLC